MTLSTRDHVRLLIGDTDPNAPRLNDEELDHFLTDRGDDVYLAAADACDALAAEYATQFDFSTDNQSFSRSQVVEKYREMAETYRSRGEGAASVSTTRIDGYSDDITNREGETGTSNRLTRGVGVYGYDDRTP